MAPVLPLRGQLHCATGLDSYEDSCKSRFGPTSVRFKGLVAPRVFV
jgi:hypothetical protein